jgi:hypothetical protein
MTRSLVLFLCLCWVAAPGVVFSAPERKTAEGEMAQGERDFADAEALSLSGDEKGAAQKLRSAEEHFREARQLAPEATGPMLGLGLALAGMGRCEDALLSLNAYLEKKAAESNPSGVSAQEKCLVATKVGGYVSFHSRPGAVSVILRAEGGDSVSLGVTPTSSRFLERGKYRVTFSRDGRSVTRSFRIRGGESLLLDSRLFFLSPPRNSRFWRRFLWAGAGLVVGAGAGLAVGLSLHDSP